METTFSKGQKVYSKRFGEGIVTKFREVNAAGYKGMVVVVQFEGELFVTFDILGRYSWGSQSNPDTDLNPVLSGPDMRDVINDLMVGVLLLASGGIGYAIAVATGAACYG